MDKAALFAECREIAPDFRLLWGTNARGDTEVRAIGSCRGFRYIVAHTVVTSSHEVAECTVMQGLIDALRTFGAAHAEDEEATS